jgi:hypothetical protein
MNVYTSQKKNLGNETYIMSPTITRDIYSGRLSTAEVGKSSVFQVTSLAHLRIDRNNQPL